MQERLKDFIQENKAAFDELEPSESSWSKLEANLSNTNLPKQGNSLLQKLLVAAAIAALIISSVALYYAVQKKNDQQNLVQHPNDSLQQPTEVRNIVVDKDTNYPLVNQNPQEVGSQKNNQQYATAPNEINTDQALNKYAKLVELRQQQLGILKTDNPQLYKRFEADLQSLEFSYEALKEKAAKGANKQLVLEAMIQNLQYQAELLNKQLEIIKHFNELKNNKNENDNKTM